MNQPDPRHEALRVPFEFYTFEMDVNGNRLTEPLKLNGAGWGEQDEMVPLGNGRVGWAYIPDPKLVDVNAPPNCNSKELQFSAYHSEN